MERCLILLFNTNRKKNTAKLAKNYAIYYSKEYRLQGGAIMLKRFCVENYRGFEQKICFDLGTPNNYSFHPEVIENGCITKGIIFGINSCGKSNFGLAIFDIITHLTEKQKLQKNDYFYLNLNEKKPFAEFEYVFQFDNHELSYKYKKTSVDNLLSESIKIDHKEVLYYDFEKREGNTALIGSETLNSSLRNESPISRVKYVYRNSILQDNEENHVFQKFMDYVDHMLLFYSLDNRGYEGFKNGADNILESIVNDGKVEEFQKFLADNEINYDLYAKDVDGTKTIYCKFNNQSAPFWRIASTGTKSLTLFYYWYTRMESASLVFIDEFDAFYHFELSDSVIRLLRSIRGVQIFTTTHNTNLLNNDLLRPDCFFILNDNKIKPISNLTEKELRFAHNLQKMYKAGAFNVK